MRHLAEKLGERATVLRTGTYRSALEELGRPVVVHEPTSHAAADLVARLQADGLVEEVLPTPMFALCRTDFVAWAGGSAARSGWRTSTAPSAAASRC